MRTTTSRRAPAGNACEPADINVGLFAAASVVAPATPLWAGLARRMLRTLRVRQPTSMLTLPMFLLAGCVLPVGPQFRDPPGNENMPPRIINSTPAQGSTVTITPNSDQDLELTIVDPNHDDKLYVH